MLAPRVALVRRLTEHLTAVVLTLATVTHQGLRWVACLRSVTLDRPVDAVDLVSTTETDTMCLGLPTEVMTRPAMLAELEAALSSTAVDTWQIGLHCRPWLRALPAVVTVTMSLHRSLCPISVLRCGSLL